MEANGTEGTLGVESNLESGATLGYVQAGILILFSVFVVTGNILTILAVYRTPSLRTIPNMYVVSLSVADVLTGLSTFYGSVFLVPPLPRIIDNNIYLCLSRYCVVSIACFASVTNLVAVSVDRYLFIVHPLFYIRKITVTKAALIISVSWTFSVACGILLMYKNTWAPGLSCHPFNVVSAEYQAGVIGLVYGCGSVVIFWSYGSILRVVRQQRRKIHIVTVVSTTFDSGTADASPRPDVSVDLKIIKVFFFVFGLFFLCWLPTSVGVVLELFTSVPDGYTGFAFVFGILNSGLNVFVYVLRYTEFRKAFADMLCSRCRQSH